MKRNVLPIFIKPRVAAELFGMSQWQVYRLVYDKKVDSRKVGRSVLIKTEDLVNLLNLDPKDVQTLLEAL